MFEGNNEARLKYSKDRGLTPLLKMEENFLLEYQPTYKNIEFTIDQPALWCEACGEGVIDGKDSKAVMPLILSEKARIDGLLTPEEIKRVRIKLKLTQKQAAAIFGGGVNAFNRYEKGKLPIPRPLSLLLTVLRNHPNQLKEITLLR
jgi:HTH-type transcriptional regulator/antitoxin MqsA